MIELGFIPFGECGEQTKLHQMELKAVGVRRRVPDVGEWRVIFGFAGFYLGQMNKGLKRAHHVNGSEKGQQYT